MRAITVKPSFFFLLSLVFGLICSLLASRYWEVSSEGLNIWSGLFFYAFAFFYYSALSLFLFLVPAVLGYFGFSRAAKFFALIFGASFLVIYLADTFVFQQFRLHLNVAMLQMTLLGGGQIVSFSHKAWFLIAALVLGCAAVVLFALWVVGKWCRVCSKKALISLVVFFVLGFSAVELTFGYAFAKQMGSLTFVSSTLPWNAPLRFNKLLIRLGLLTQEEVYKVKVGAQKGVMNYPLHELQCFGGKELNIVFIFVDSLRYDMVTDEIMPIVSGFAKSSTVFKEHYSGGINTRHGIFTLFTGLPASYWDKSLLSKSGSVFISALQKRGYELGIFTGAPLTMPEFNQTIFADIPNLRLFPKGNTPIERDNSAVEDFSQWLRKVPKDKHFFSFIFFDNVHAAAFPEDRENTIFTPYWKTVNHLELSNSFNREPYFNRYKNSVHYADKNIGKVLEILKENDALKDSIIVISSDHGEEFNDNKLNFWGHNGNFTKFQAKVPLIIKWPGKNIFEVNYRTSMLDVVPTFLPEVFGCKNPIEDYSVGENLWSPSKDREWLYSGNYSQNAFLEKDRIILINELGIMKYLDQNYRTIEQSSPPKYLKKVLEETTKFLK